MKIRPGVAKKCGFPGGWGAYRGGGNTTPQYL